MLEITLDGGAELIRRAEKAGPVVKLAVAQEIERTALKITRTAKRNAPVDTGYLRNNISNQRVSLFAQKVEARAEYSGHVNFGTKNQRANPFFSTAVQSEGSSLKTSLRTALRGKL